MRSRRRRPAGLALATTLCVVFLILIFALTITMLATFEYQSAAGMVDRHRAFEAAQAGLARAMYELGGDSSWGSRGETLSGACGDGSRWRLTFDPASVLPYSVNNAHSANGCMGWQGSVAPPHAILLLAQGESPRGYTVTQEAVVQPPPYPYALAATNRIFVRGEVLVKGASSVEKAKARSFDLPGSVYGRDVLGGPGSQITGSAHGHRSVAFGPKSKVGKGIKILERAPALPDIDIAGFNNRTFEGVVQLAPGLHSEHAVLSGPVYVYGTVIFAAGLELRDAYLFVDGGGDLVVDDDVSGTGSIFVTGAAWVEGGISIETRESVALFANRGIRLEDGYFQGILYTHGDLVASEQVRILGIGIAMSPSHAGGRIQVEGGIEATYVEDYARIGSSWASRGGSSGPVKPVFWGGRP